MKLLALLSSVLLTIACASASSKIIAGPSGQRIVKTSCHPDVSRCFEEAARVCPKGYDIVNVSSHMGGTVIDLMPGPVTWYDVLVQCH